MRANSFPSVSLFVFLFLIFFSEHQTLKNSRNFPISIKYLDNHPPDSVKSFIKTILVMSKLEVITTDEMMKLMMEQIRTVSMDWIEGGKLSGIDTDASKKDKLGAEMVKPVCNMLIIKWFNINAVKNENGLDSIQWEIKQVPGSDTTFKPMTFKPVNKISNVYIQLKQFCDLILNSGFIK